MLQRMVPGMARLAYLINPKNRYFQMGVANMKTLTQQARVELLITNAESATELEPAFTAMSAFRADAVVVENDPSLWGERKRIATLALGAKIPSMFGSVECVEAGGLMSYGSDEDAEMRQVASYVDKIFRGVNPGEIPIQQPTKVELAINRKTARLLGLTIPKLLTMQAQRLVD